MPEIGTPGSGSGGWKRNHGSRTEDRSESDGYATGPYRRRASPRLYPRSLISGHDASHRCASGGTTIRRFVPEAAHLGRRQVDRTPSQLDNRLARFPLPVRFLPSDSPARRTALQMNLEPLANGFDGAVSMRFGVWRRSDRLCFARTRRATVPGRRCSQRLGEMSGLLPTVLAGGFPHRESNSRSRSRAGPAVGRYGCGSRL